jgi:dihydroorotate dehydrogenase (fumarate)
MVDLKTSYMGIPLSSPLVVAACTISGMTDRIVLAEQAGAGALVIRSLFEEQIQFDALRMQESLAVGGESQPEATSYFPKIRHGEADEHVMWVEKSRKAVKMPLIASLNAVSPGSWTKYAKQLEGTGIDGLELNVYSLETNPRKNAA